MLDWIKRGFKRAQPAADPYEQFVVEFATECKRQNCMPKSYDPQARAFLFGREDGGEWNFHLDNMFGLWLPQERSGRAELITRFVHSVEEARRPNIIDPEKLPGELMPAIRSRAQISNALIRNWTAGAPTDDSTATAFAPFEGDLVACVVRSLAYGIAQMAHNNLSVGNLSLEQAMSHALKNFRDRLPRPAFEPFGDGVFCCSNLEDYQSALLLLEPGRDYSLPPIDGAPIAGVPSRNLFYLTGSANRPGLARLLDIAGQAHQMPHFCSSAVLQWNGGRWSEALMGDDDFAARRRATAQHQLAADYASQKQLLDNYHHQQGQDIFVASLMLFSPKDSSELISSAALGSSTTGTLLPRTDRLLFVKQIVDPQTGLAAEKPEDSVNVTWSSAMDIVGHLFEPMPYLYPLRLRALGFPQSDDWPRLKAVAVPSG